MKHRLLVALVSVLVGAAAVATAADDVLTGVAAGSALNLSGSWRCKPVAQVEDSLFSPSTDDSSWQVVPAPARWADQNSNKERAPAVVYRRSVKVPSEWQGRKVGISAWFCAGDSLVYVNGLEVDPVGPPNAMYGDVSGILRYGQENLVAVSTTGDGIRELAESGPPLLGPLGEKHLTRVIRSDVSIPAQPRPLPASLFLPEAAQPVPLVIFAATGHADYSVKDDWRQLNDDLARLGYASLAVVFSKFTPQEFQAVAEYAAGLQGVDHSRTALVGAMKATRPVVLAAVASHDVRTVVLVSSARIPEIAQLGQLPVLFICGERESSVPALTAARDMAASLEGPHDVASLASTESGVALLDTSWNGLRQALLDWLRRYLGGPASPSTSGDSP